MKLQLEDNLTFLPTQGPASPHEGEIFSCDLCPKTFLQLDALRSHTRNHLLSCTDCNRTFTDQPALNKHQEEVHGQEKSFHCSQCDKSFKELRTLRLHLKIHNSEYPEHCEVCKKGFRTKWQLKQHLMDHGGKRPYPCPECTFTCKTKQQLNEHRRKHSGEKAYSCPLCGTRFTYRNGLIKHTKLNRCPKKIIAPDGDRIAKKKTKIIDQLARQKFELMNTLDEKARSEKSLLDQKILDVIQKRSALKGQLGMPQDLNNNPGPAHSQHVFSKAQLVRELVPGQISLPHCSASSSTTTTFLTNSTDISSWAATLPAGTKVTVTHYDASKKSGGGELVATPTHTETIIVTPPTAPRLQAGGPGVPGGSPGLPLQPGAPLLPLQPSAPLPLLRLPPPLSRHSPSTPGLLDSLSVGESPPYPEYPAMDPHDLLLKTESQSSVKLEPLSPGQAEYASTGSTTQPQSPPSVPDTLEAQLRSQPLLMNVQPEPSFDPNMKIKKELDNFESSLSGMSAQQSLSLPCSSPNESRFASTTLNEIKKEVLSELFDDERSDDKSKLLDRQLSVKSEQDEDMVSDEFYDISFKLEPIASPHSNSSISESDHDSFSFHRDLDAIVNNFSKSSSRDTEMATVGDLLGQAGKHDIPVLPNLDLDFHNFFDDNIADVSINDQDFFQMNMDTFEAASELVPNV